MMKKRRFSSISARERRASTMKALGGLGEHLYNQMINEEFPWVRIPSRSTANIHYDEEHRQYVLGDKSVRRSSRNIRHIRPLTRLVWTARFVHSLCDAKKTSTLRDVFYSAQAYDVYFKDQAESDKIITDLESVLGYAREDLNVFPEERSVCGDEIILLEKEGFLRTERIGDFVESYLKAGKDDPSEVKSMAVSSNGERHMSEIEWAMSHNNNEPVYEVKLKGGYSVKLSGSHSIMVVEDYKIMSKKVAELRKEDLVPVCFNIPNKEHVTKINIAELILKEGDYSLDDVYVVGDGNPRRFIKKGMSNKSNKYRLRIYRKIMEQGMTPLSAYEERGRLPKEGYLRLKYARDKVPVCIKVTSDLCKILGYYVSEGDAVPGRMVRFSFGKTSEKWRDDLKLCFKRCFSYKLSEDKNPKSQLRYYGKTLSWILPVLLRAGTRAVDKEIPFIVFNFPNNMKMEFLKAYLRGDGCLYVKEKKSDFALMASTISRKLASDLCILFAQLGIFVTFRRGKPRSHVYRERKIIGKHDLYDIVIRGVWLKRLSAFINETFGETRIPLKVGRQQLAHCYKRGLLKPLLKLLPYEQRRRYSGKSISWLKAKEIADKVGQLDERGKFLSNLIKNRVIPIEVKSIGVKEEPTKLYDVELNPSHTFVCGLGPIIVHNSAVFGDLTVEYTVPGYEGRRLNLTTHPDGIMIGPALTSADFVKTSAQRAIVIEKGAMFTRLVEEGAFKKFNAILVHTAGQPPRATRRFVKRLNEELNLPVFIFCDADPWGMAIAVTIICGSANAAHIRGLTTPEAVWMGVYSTDIEEYSLPSNKLSEADVKRLRDMLKDPRYQGEPWANQINDFLRRRRKCELEAFSRYGLDYVVKKYLPDKFREFGV